MLSIQNVVVLCIYIGTKVHINNITGARKNVKCNLNKCTYIFHTIINFLNNFRRYPTKFTRVILFIVTKRKPNIILSEDVLCFRTEKKTTYVFIGFR